VSARGREARGDTRGTRSEVVGTRQDGGAGGCCVAGDEIQLQPWSVTERPGKRGKTGGLSVCGWLGVCGRRRYLGVSGVNP